MQLQQLVTPAIALLTVAGTVAAAEMNLLRNGTLDAVDQLSGWDIYLSPEPPDVQLTWTADDAGSDPDSGSIQIDGAGYGEGGPACFEVTPNAAYSFGGQSKSAGPNATLAYEYCSTYSDDHCYLGKSALAQVAMNSAAAWVNAAPTNGTLTAAARSVRCEFVIFSQGAAANAISVRFDNLYFNSSVPVIFQDGFEALGPTN